MSVLGHILYSDEHEYSNIRIFEYSNKMALKYYSYLYACHFPSTNIFGYSFVDFWTTEYIQIFAQNLILIFDYLFLMKKVYLDIPYA